MYRNLLWCASSLFSSYSCFGVAALCFVARTNQLWCRQEHLDAFNSLTKQQQHQPTTEKENSVFCFLLPSISLPCYKSQLALDDPFFSFLFFSFFHLLYDSGIAAAAAAGSMNGYRCSIYAQSPSSLSIDFFSHESSARTPLVVSLKKKGIYKYKTKTGKRYNPFCVRLRVY